MKKILVLLVLFPSICFAQHNGPYPNGGGGSGGTTVNNFFNVTNVPSGWQEVAVFGLTNVAIPGSTAGPLNFTLSGVGSFLNGNQSGTNGSILAGGLYELAAYAPSTMSGGTNFILTVVTNLSGVAQAASGITLTITTGGSATIFNSPAVLLQSNTLASLNVVNNGTTLVVPANLQVSVWKQVPAGVASVNTTNTVNSIVSSTNILTGNTLWVDAVNGNDTTGTRGNLAFPFATPHAAAAKLQAGDTMVIEPGTYNEGSNTMGQVPKNVSIFGLSQPVIIYTNFQAATITAASIYIQPNDNLKISGLWFQTPVSNFFSAILGSVGNVTGTATNLDISISTYNADSDVFYFGGTNLVTAKIHDGQTHYYWDGWAITSAENTNDVFYIQDYDFDCDYRNGINPSARSGMNMSSGGGTFYLNNVHINMPVTNGAVPSYGIRAGTLAIVFYNKVEFNDVNSSAGAGTPHFGDIVYGQATSAGGSIGVVNSMNTNALVYFNAGVAGLPQNLGGASFYGTYTVPLTVSQDPADALFYGSWVIQDEGTNGGLVISNANNGVTSGLGLNPAWVEIQPSSIGSSIPVPGLFKLHNLAFSGDGSGITNIAGVNGIVMTNIVGAITGTNSIRYTVPAGVTNSYTLEGYLTVTALSLDVIQPKIVWTDENGTVQTVSLGSSVSGTGYNNLPYTFIKAKGGTVIFETNALTTGTGSITYNTEVHLAGVSGNQ